MTNRILRADAPQTMFSTWSEMVGFNGTVVGEETNILPSLAKNENSSLWVDSEGYIYIFNTIGELRPNVETWKISQSRYRLLTPTTGSLYFDSFSAIGQNREPGDQLDATDAEIGGTRWSAAPELVFGSEAVTSSLDLEVNKLAMLPIDVSGNTVSRLEAIVDLTASEWVA